MSKVELSAKLTVTEAQLQSLEQFLGPYQSFQEEISVWKKAADPLFGIPQSVVRVQGNLCAPTSSLVYLGRIQRTDPPCRAQSVCIAEVKEDPKVFLSVLGFEQSNKYSQEGLQVRLDSTFRLTVMRKDADFPCEIIGVCDDLDLGWAGLQSQLKRVKQRLDLA